MASRNLRQIATRVTRTAVATNAEGLEVGEVPILTGLRSPSNLSRVWMLISVRVARKRVPTSSHRAASDHSTASTIPW